ncbi:MAG: DUF1553 domain-containing protein [Pirellulaceae bacterium]|nr:DUF1553 domain-containing protein [Pirellulaceae bacterium]
MIRQLALTSLFVASVATAAAADKLEYNRDIRPIFAENCFACHGPDSAARKGDLRLDRREMAMQMTAIVPGKPDESALVARIHSDNPDERMPPPESKKELTAAQKETLRRWIAEGAEYQPHWSFIAPKRPALPAVKNAAWVKNPIDAFVLARLEAMGLSPAPEADKRTLARRLSLDITGLPPAPALVEKFVSDTDANAYEKLIDELMQSKNWGEHRGRYWLDAARYADTNGIHFDNFRENWAYREWLIDAFNRNVPFDQFTIEQLAGDLLPNRTLDQQIASGFNRCNITTNEGGSIAEEYLVLYNRDRTETTSQVWLGLTTGCAVCHDHKFDPLKQKEFYELAAFFNNTTQAAMDGNIKDTPPILPVPKAEDRPRLDAIDRELAEAHSATEARKTAAKADYDGWLASASVETLVKSLPTKDLYLSAPLAEGDGKTTKVQLDGQEQAVPLTDSAKWQPGASGGKALQTQGTALELPNAADFEKEQPFSCSAWIKILPNDSQGAICARMDNTKDYRGWDFWVQARRAGMHIVNTWPGDAVKVVAQAQVPANEWTYVSVTYDGSGKASGVKVYYNGQPQKTNVEADKLQNSIRTTVPFKLGQRHASEPLSGLTIQDLRIYKCLLSPAEIESLAKISRFAGILTKAADQRTDAEKNELYQWWLGTFDKAFQDLASKVGGLEKEQAAIKGRGTVAHVMQEKMEEPGAFILFRGEYDKRRDAVKASTPEFLPPMPADLARNRLGLAKWLLREDHPLTARVTVNRFWQELFGTGLVRTSGDFGVSGELPSHPELLDWMAVKFREGDSGQAGSLPHGAWDMKRFFKQILMSNTYRQAAIATPEKLEKDASNRFFSRGPRFRMDGEMIRDYALASSGILVSKLGGPSVKPYQPDGVWEAVAIIGSNTRDYKPDSGENLYRRSLYTFWKRSAPPASMEIFGAPNRETCTVRRERTNTPLQALVTLNDVQFIEAARHLAQLTLKSPATKDEERLDFVSRRILARPFRGEELPVVQASLSELQKFYAAHVEDAKKLISEGESKADASLDPAALAAWTMLVNELMNLDEVLNK